MATKVKTMASKATTNGSTRHWRSVLDDLAQQRAEAAERLDKLARTKQPLRAFTGDAEARAELDRVNGEARGIEQLIGDLDAAITEAEAELARAEQAEGAARERERLAELRRRAEARVAAAAAVEQQVKALAVALGNYDRAGADIMAMLRPSDDAIVRKMTSPGRLSIMFAAHLGRWIGASSTRDDRTRETFEARERTALASLLLTDEGLARLAEVEAAA